MMTVSFKTTNALMIDLQLATRLFYAELLNWSRTAVRYLPKLAVAITLLLVFTFLSRLISRWVSQGLHRISHNYSLVNLTSAVVRVLVMALGFFIALGVLGLDKTVTSLLAGAGVIALAVGFAFQDLTTNFISGTMLAIARPLQVGDVVDTNGFNGKVLDVKLRSVVLDNGQGQTVEIPSKDVFQKPITNYSRIGLRRIEVAAGVSYVDDLGKAQQLAQTAVSQLPFVIHDRPVELCFRTFGDSNIQFVLWFWINPAATSPPAALSEAIKAIKHTFDDNQILTVFAGQTFDLKQQLQDARTLPPA